jgi:hypothetical protein
VDLSRGIYTSYAVPQLSSISCKKDADFKNALGKHSEI